MTASTRGMLIAASMLTLLLSGCERHTPSASQTPLEVGVIAVTLQQHTQTVELPARISARRAAEIRPQVDGIIKAELFRPGDTVKAGQPLYQLEDRRYQAQANRAAAALQQAKVTRDTRAKLYQRSKQLLAQQATSQQEADEIEQRYLEAGAALQLAMAEQQLAQINLEDSKIRSPIAGRVEVSQVTEGALVSARQSAALTTVLQIDPVYADITFSGSGLNALRHAAKNQALSLHLILEDGSRYPLPGELQFNSAQVTASSGANLWRARFANPDAQLLPGMFVRVELHIPQAEQRVSIPQQALQRDPNGDAYVFVIDSDGKLQQRHLQLGAAIGDQWLVIAGLSEGEQIVVEGLQHARVGRSARAVLLPTPSTAQAHNG